MQNNRPSPAEVLELIERFELLAADHLSIEPNKIATSSEVKQLAEVLGMECRRRQCRSGSYPFDKVQEKWFSCADSEVRVAMRELKTSIAFEMEGNGEPGKQTQPDGPDANSVGLFYWKGSPHPIGKRNWELCCAIWDNPGIGFLEVASEVWGQEETPNSTIRSAISRLNDKMLELKIPLSWANHSERIYPEGFEPKPVAD